MDDEGSVVDVSITNPPILQLVLTASFTPALDSLSIIDLADLYGIFRADYPIFQQINRAGPMSFRPLEFPSTGAGGLPRIAFASSDTTMQLAFQNDRLTAIWNRGCGLGENPQYPGFAFVAKSLFDALTKLKAWVAQRGLNDIEPAVGEIVYNDAFSLHDNAGAEIPMARIVSVANPAVVFPLHVAEYSWIEPLGVPVEGYAHVEITAPGQLPDNSMALTVETTISFDPGGDWGTAQERFETGHQVALRVFDRVINRNALAISA